MFGRKKEERNKMKMCEDTKDVFIENEVHKKFYDSKELWIETPCRVVKHGEEKVYYKTGEVQCITPYKDGKIEGLYQTFYRSGAKEIEVFFENGKKVGIENRFYECGLLQNSVSYINGLKEGVEKQYYDTGELYSEVNYSKDDKNGLQTTYHKSGRVYSRCPFKDGAVFGDIQAYLEEDSWESGDCVIEQDPS